MNEGANQGMVGIQGDFERVFDPHDYLAIVNGYDEASVVLRIHLVLEEFLNIWAARITQTEDLFDGTFVPFKTKLAISRNIGLDSGYADALHRINEIRNRYSHRRKYMLEESSLLAVRDQVDALECGTPVLQCEQFQLWMEGYDQTGQRQKIALTWATSDTKKRLAMVQVVLVLKLARWMQAEFNRRGIAYDLAVFSLPPFDEMPPTR
ncbi:MAG: hypothetical protein M0Q22_12155 [Sulfuritalea sp.]|jgi:hypothetical protein|nr:hypothetical protein [Sulfuritalea sp.]